MNRRSLLVRTGLGIAGLGITWLSGCRGHQYAQVLSSNQTDMVGSHTAGAETFNPLIDEAVARLLGRQQPMVHPVSAPLGPQAPAQVPLAGPPRRICFIAVENRSAEELGDFKEQIYQQIDTQILQSQAFQPVSRRLIDAALRETRMKPDELFLPQNRALFAASLAQGGEPFEYLLYATLTSGTTQSNKNNYQRDYLLTLEMVNMTTGQYDKESAKVRKGYHKSRVGSLWHYNPLKRS